MKSRADIDPVAFVRAWEASDTLRDCATQLGWTGELQCLSAHASYFRRCGVALKVLIRGRKGMINVDELNDLIDEERGK